MIIQIAIQKSMAIWLEYSVSEHCWMAVAERVRQDWASLFGQGSLKNYQEALSRQIIHGAFQRPHYTT